MSHHGNGMDDEMRRLIDERSNVLREKMRGVFGEYPNGRLNENDAGALAVAIGQENGAVTLAFPKPIEWIGFTPEQAIDIANTLIKHARALGFKEPVKLVL